LGLLALRGVSKGDEVVKEASKVWTGYLDKVFGKYLEL